MSQPVVFTSAGIYSISFSAAGRVPYAAGSGGNLHYTVKVAPNAGGPTVLSATYTTADSQPFTKETHDFTIPAPGDYIISFATVSGYGEYGDNAALITGVSLSVIAYPVVIDTQPQNEMLLEGSSATFAVTASGTPPLSYQWLFNGTMIDGATATNFVINNVQPADAGSYSVIISNAAGAVISTPAVLAVQEFPHAATATAVVTNGFVIGATVTDAGFGYTNTPTVRIIGGGGSGAQAVAVVGNGGVVAVNILDTGDGYTNTPVVVVAPPFIEQPAMSIAPMSFLTFSNLAVGANYQLESLFAGALIDVGAPFNATSSISTQLVSRAVWTNNYLLTTTLNSTQAQASAVVVNGFVIGTTVTSGGSGYTTTPTVTILNDGAGSNATAIAYVGDGSVTNITITSPGIGYTNGATIIIEPPPLLALSPNVTPVMKLDLGSSAWDMHALSPYDNYQLQFTPVVGGVWTNLGAPFAPTSVTNTQYINVSGNAGFFRAMHLP